MFPMTEINHLSHDAHVTFAKNTEALKDALNRALLSEEVTLVSKHPGILVTSSIYKSEVSLLMEEEGIQPFAFFEEPPLFHQMTSRFFSHELILSISFEKEEEIEGLNRFMRIIEAQLRPSHQTLSVFENDKRALRTLFEEIERVNENLTRITIERNRYGRG